MALHVTGSLSFVLDGIYMAGFWKRQIIMKIFFLNQPVDKGRQPTDDYGLVCYSLAELLHIKQIRRQTYYV